MSLAPDQLELQISNLLRDNVDERIANIEHRAIEFGKGYLYVIRIPASPRAPHMVTLPSRRPRFYMRATTSNDPMNAQQIREVAMRSETAYDRVREQITKRVEEVERLVRSRPGANREFLVLHFLPLFPPRGGVDLSSRDLYRRWYSVKPFGCEGSHVTVRMSLDGIAAESSVPDELYSSTVLLREGGLEFTQVAMAYPLAGRGGERVLNAIDLEQEVLAAGDQARGLADEGLLSLPIVMSLRLGNLAGLTVYAPRARPGKSTIAVSDVPIAPVEIHSWDDIPNAARSLFHVMWQALGWARSPSYRDDGSRDDSASGPVRF